MIRALAIILAVQPCVAHALDFDMPGNARLVYERVTGPDSYAFPTGPYKDGALPIEQVSGNVSRQVFRIDSQGTTSLQLFEPLQEMVGLAGLETVLDCVTDQCGGFDFRFETEVAPAPDMYVDLTDYRFLSAKRQGSDGIEYLSLMVSRSDLAGYVQLIRVSPSTINPVVFSEPAIVTNKERESSDPLPVQALEGNGFAILSDLTFKVGSATLGEGPFASLEALAVYLTANPERQMALVGHTDTEGTLDNNIALSKRRAAAVLERLVKKFGVNRAQLAAEGMGYLSPVASNLTAEGRDANRRVEAILLNTE